MLCCALAPARRCHLSPIAVYLPKSAGVFFADLGIVYTENIYINLDIKSPAQRIRGIIESIGPILKVTSRALAPQLAAIAIPDEKCLFIVKEMLTSEGGEGGAAAQRGVQYWQRELD